MGQWNQDFEEFFALLNGHRVEYLIIGGVAFNYHATPRATKDIVVWVRPDRQNLERLLQAIRAFGFPTEGVATEDLATKARVLLLGRLPNRIDVLTNPAGLRWESAVEGKVQASYGRTPVGILGLSELIESKRAAGRARDLADVEALELVARKK